MKILVSCRLFISPIPSSQTSQTFDTWLLTQGFSVWSHDLMERIQPLSSIKNCSIWLFAKNQIHKYLALLNSWTSGWQIPCEMVCESVSQVYHFPSINSSYCPIYTHCNYQKVIILFSSNKRPESILTVTFKRRFKFILNIRIYSRVTMKCHIL